MGDCPLAKGFDNLGYRIDSTIPTSVLMCSYYIPTIVLGFPL